MGMFFAGTWAGEQLPVVSGTEVIIREDLIEGQSWSMGVVLLVTVGVVLLICVLAVLDPHLPTGNVHMTREPAIAMQWRCMSPRALQDDDLDHLGVTKTETWYLSQYSGTQLEQLMMSNMRSLCGSWYSSCGTLPARMRSRPTFALFSCCRDFFDWVTGGVDYWYEV